MASLDKLKKAELIAVVEELELSIEGKTTIISLKRAIENSDVYKNARNTFECVVASVLEEHKAKLESEEAEKNKINSALEVKKIRLAQIERQIQLANIQRELPFQILEDGAKIEEKEKPESLESLIKSVHTLTIRVPSQPEG